MALALSEVERLKRKLRKKLRQIENLEITDRELNNEELDKISKKGEIRKELSDLIKSCDSQEIEEVENSFTFVEKAELSVEEQSNQSTEAENKEEQLGFWQLDDSSDQPSDEMKRKSTEFYVDDTEHDIYVDEKKLCLEVVQTVAKAKADNNSPKVGDKTAPTQTSDKLTESQPVVSIEESNTKIRNDSSKAPQPKTSQASKQAATKPSVPSDLAKWRKVSWSVEELCGHDDLVLDCDVDPNLGIAITCSRDTTVKVWSLSGGSLVHSLRGHTGPVTGVRFVSKEATEALALALDAPDLTVCAVSGSQDCSVKVWDLVSGSLVKSYYTYNGITRLEVVPGNTCTITGTDGGKLEMFDMATGHCPFSQRVHEEAVTALCVRHGAVPSLLSGGEDGIIKLFALEDKSLRCVFVSENVKADPDVSVHNRPVYSITIGASGLLYYGDDGCNIKAIDWKKGKLRKIANHAEDVGFTDAVAVAGDLLVASTYDIDTGQGGLNLFYELPEGGQIPKYVATLMDGDTTRISSLRAKISNGSLTVISCGQEVKLWRQEVGKSQKSKDGSTSIRGCVLKLDKGLVYDSGSDGELDSDGEDGLVRSVSVGVGVGVGERSVPFDQKSTGFCNCNIM